MISDQSFIADHRAVYAEWEQQPGVADLQRLFELAIKLGISSGGEVFRDYDRVLALYRAGNTVLVRTEREARRAASDPQGAEQIALVMDMDETRLSLWAPASDGSAEMMDESRAEFWDAALAMGIVLYAPNPTGARR